MTAINVLVCIGVIFWAFTVLTSPPGQIEAELTKDPGAEMFIRSFFPSVEAFWFLFVVACWPMLIVQILRKSCPEWFPAPDDEDADD